MRHAGRILSLLAESVRTLAIYGRVSRLRIRSASFRTDVKEVVTLLGKFKPNQITNLIQTCRTLALEPIDAAVNAPLLCNLAQALPGF